MAKINIKFMTDEAYETLKTNIETYTPNFINNPTDSSWINGIISEKVFEIKKFQIEDFELKIPSGTNDKETDIANSIILYETLNTLPKYVLSEPRFWLWLMFEKTYEVALALMEKKDATAFKHQWLFVDGLRRGIFFGVISRCYYRVALSVLDGDVPDKYELSRYAIENPTRFREITWRTVSNHSHVVQSLLKAEKRANEEYSFEENGKLYAALAKEVCKLGSIKLIDVMTEEDIEDYIYHKYVEMIQKSLYEKNKEIYDKAKDNFDKNTESSLRKAQEQLESIINFEDSQILLEKCIETLKEIEDAKSKKGLSRLFKRKKK